MRSLRIVSHSYEDGGQVFRMGVATDFPYIDGTKQFRALLLDVLGKISRKLRSKILVTSEVVEMNKTDLELFYDSV
jgi:hypothetical protein